MNLIVLKRDGSESRYDPDKIRNAISKANDEVPDEHKLGQDEITEISRKVGGQVVLSSHAVGVEEIQDMIEKEFVSRGKAEILRRFMTYRWNRTLSRKANTTDGKILSLLRGQNEVALQENSNKNPLLNSTMRDYLAGEVSRDVVRRFVMPKDVMEAHDAGIIHISDMDYISMRLHNCCLVNLEDMLQNGTVIQGAKIETPHRFSTACTIATQVMVSVSSSQYGGQTISLAHLSPFVDVSRKNIAKDLEEELEEAGVSLSQEAKTKIVEKRLRQEIRNGVQTMQYQINTISGVNGQAPFVSIWMWLDEVPEGRPRDDLAMVIEEVLKQRIQGVKNLSGAWVAPAFPKLLYALDEDNVHEDSKYFYLTELAAKCTAKRLVPDYISVKKMKELKGDVYPCMGCRSFLTPDQEGLGSDGSHKYYGRFNQGVVTINLVDVACSSYGDEKRFWELLDERTELCKKALMVRHHTLLGTPSGVAPILWQNGALARLSKGETIDKLLFNNYSTISLGYGGLAECVRRMKGCSHTSPVGKEFGLRVMRYLNDKCQKWRSETGISFSLYGSPMETMTYKFAKCLQKRFGEIAGVTDKNYITNSYHVPVTEEIDAFSKLSLEAEFQELSPGGAVSYVEVPNMQGNIPAVLAIMRHIYDLIMYAELNTKSDYCEVCSYDGEIQIVEDERGKLVWECPNCGNRDQSKMQVARRTCGYIGTQYWNQGRTQEIRERVLHVSKPVD